MKTSVISRRPSFAAASFRWRNCSTISPLVRLRCNPARVLAQKSHPIAHPICDDTHPAARSGLCDGISTVSTAWVEEKCQ